MHACAPVVLQEIKCLATRPDIKTVFFGVSSCIQSDCRDATHPFRQCRKHGARVARPALEHGGVVERDDVGNDREDHRRGVVEQHRQEGRRVPANVTSHMSITSIMGAICHHMSQAMCRGCVTQWSQVPEGHVSPRSKGSEVVAHAPPTASTDQTWKSKIKHRTTHTRAQNFERV